VINSTSLANDLKEFAFREWIWICEVKYISAIATALRVNLQDILEAFTSLNCGLKK